MIDGLFMLAVLILQVGMTNSSVKKEGPWTVERLVRFHQQHKRDLAVQDAYKMLYQANMGVRHVLGDSASVAGYLQKEMESLDTTDRGEELVERIATDDVLVRVNLRPFKALRLPQALLVECMWKSAQETRPDTAGFYRQWNEFKRLVEIGRLEYSREEVKRWEQEPRRGGLKAAHHSPSYVARNRPAYRVVRRSVFERLIGKNR